VKNHNEYVNELKSEIAKLTQQTDIVEAVESNSPRVEHRHHHHVVEQPVALYCQERAPIVCHEPLALTCADYTPSYCHDIKPDYRDIRPSYCYDYKPSSHCYDSKPDYCYDYKPASRLYMRSSVCDDLRVSSCGDYRGLDMQYRGYQDYSLHAPRGLYGGFSHSSQMGYSGRFGAADCGGNCGGSCC
jgi:hypothetical protein